MRTLLVHNPTAGGGLYSKDDLLDALRLGAHSPDYRSTKRKGWDKGWDKSLRRDVDLIVVAGGDGTVAKVARRIAGLDVPLAILPLGSANNIARSFGISGTPLELAEILHRDRCEQLRLGLLHGPWGKRKFVEAVGLGPFPRTMQEGVVASASGAESLRMGRKALRKMLEKAKPLEVEIEVDGRPLKGDLLGVEIVNTAYTGPGLPLAPQADPGDKILEVVSIHKEDRKEMLDWLKAPQKSKPPVRFEQGRTIKIVWRDEPLRVDDELVDSAERRETLKLQLDGALIDVLVPPHRGVNGIRLHDQARRKNPAKEDESHERKHKR